MRPKGLPSAPECFRIAEISEITARRNGEEPAMGLYDHTRFVKMRLKGTYEYCERFKIIKRGTHLVYETLPKRDLRLGRSDGVI